MIMMKSNNLQPDENKTIPNPIGIPEKGIPKYDLSKQILSKHRQNTSVKRIAPSRKNSSQSRVLSTQNSIRKNSQGEHDSTGLAEVKTKDDLKSDVLNLESNNIIEDIVARDIKQLRKNRI